MKNKKKIISCFLSGAAAIAIGIFFLAAVEMEDKRIAIFFVLIILLGVYQIYLGMKFVLKVPEKPADELKTIDLKARAAEKQKAYNLTRKRSVRAEICFMQRKAGIITFVICAVLALLFPFSDIMFSYEHEFPITGVICGVLAIGSLIYGFSGAVYRKLLNEAREKGLDPEKVNEDFMRGELFKEKNTIFCVGDKYTVFVQDSNVHIIPHSDVIRVQLITVKADEYAKGLVYAGTFSSSYAVVFTGKGYYKMLFTDDLGDVVFRAYNDRRRFFTRKDFELVADN